MTAQTTLNYEPDESEKSAPEPASAPQAATSTEIVIVIDTKSTELITAFSQDKGLDPIIEKIKAKVKTEYLDVTTEDGRARIGSIARQIGSAKMDLKRMGQTLTEDWRTKTKAVTAETTRMEKELDALRDEVLAPRTEFENREKARVEAHQHRIEAISALTVFEGMPLSSEVQGRVDTLAIYKDVDWQEFKGSGTATFDKVSANLADLLVKTKQAEADAAELARHRKEQAEREQRERDEKIAAEAAAKAKAEAEEKARLEQEERDCAAAAALKVEQDRLAAAEKKAADDAAAAAKALQEAEDAKAAVKIKADNDALLAAVALRDAEDKRVADLKAADEKAERDKAAALQKQKDDAAAAQKVIDDAAKAKAVEDKKRADNVAHQKKINNEVMEALKAISPGLPEDYLKQVIISIAQGKIPHVAIAY